MFQIVMCVGIVVFCFYFFLFVALAFHQDSLQRYEPWCEPQLAGGSVQISIVDLKPTQKTGGALAAGDAKKVFILLSAQKDDVLRKRKHDVWEFFRPLMMRSPSRLGVVPIESVGTPRMQGVVLRLVVANVMMAATPVSAVLEECTNTCHHHHRFHLRRSVTRSLYMKILQAVSHPNVFTLW